MHKINILVVDDDKIVLHSCKRILEEEGFSVSLVSSSKEGLEVLENETVDLLLVDVKMPEYDGIYLMSKAKEKRPDLPIVVMSGYPTPETISDGMSKGADNFIAKPFTPDELLTSVQKVIKAHKKGLSK